MSMPTIADVGAGWHSTRDRELGDVLCALASNDASTHAPLPDGLAKERQAAWLARALDPETTASPGLHHLLLASFEPAKLKSKLASERLSAMTGWMPSPVVGRFLLQLLERPPFQSTSTKPFWKALFGELLRHAEHGFVERLAALEGNGVERIGARAMGEYFDAQIPRVRVELARALAGTTAIDGPTKRAVAAGVPAPPRAEISAEVRSREALFAAVYDAPDDDAPRAVLADALLEQADPRGEFINLQLSGAAPERQAVLVAKHGASWLPSAMLKALDRSSLRFERGFLVAAAVAPNRPLKPAVGHSEWRTVRSLDICFSVTPPTLELLVHPTLRDLRSLFRVGGTLAATYLAHEAPKGLETLMFASRFLGWDEYEHDTTNALVMTPSLPRLRHLALDFRRAEVLPLLLGSKLATQLERLTLASALRSAFDALPSSQRARIRQVEFTNDVDGAVMG